MNALVIYSGVTCYIPEFRIAFPSVVNRTAITLTNPQYPKTPISENRSLSFTIIPDSENSSDYTDILIENIGNKGVDSDLLVGL